jgi:hypothetical protein
METPIKKCDLSLEESISKAKYLEIAIKELDFKIKLERINDCEEAQKLTSETFEMLKRIVDRM